jgi:hypothetical protein
MIVVASVALGMVLYRYSTWLSEEFRGQVVIDARLYMKFVKAGARSRRHDLADF